MAANCSAARLDPLVDLATHGARPGIHRSLHPLLGEGGLARGGHDGVLELQPAEDDDEIDPVYTSCWYATRCM